MSHFHSQDWLVSGLAGKTSLSCAMLLTSFLITYLNWSISLDIQALDIRWENSPEWNVSLSQGTTNIYQYLLAIHSSHCFYLYNFGRKPETPDGTHANTGTTWETSHSMRIQHRMEPPVLATRYTTVSPYYCVIFLKTTCLWFCVRVVLFKKLFPF